MTFGLRLAIRTAASRLVPASGSGDIGQHVHRVAIESATTDTQAMWRIRLTSLDGGNPNWRLYSRLN